MEFGITPSNSTAPCYKYGYEVPRDCNHSMRLDEANRNTKWYNATILEMKLLKQQLRVQNSLLHVHVLNKSLTFATRYVILASRYMKLAICLEIMSPLLTHLARFMRSFTNGIPH